MEKNPNYCNHIPNLKFESSKAVFLANYNSRKKQDLSDNQPETLEQYIYTKYNILMILFLTV